MKHIILKPFLVITFGTSATLAFAFDKAIDEAKCAGIFYVNKELAQKGSGGNGKPVSYWQDLTEKARELAFEAAKDTKTKDAVEVEIGDISTSMGLAVEKEDPEMLAHLGEATPRCEELVNASTSTP
ncbi:hypothetical protein AUC68_07760 [Methyloceanibacter methanicus]|uniref:Uncharacterized protein n=1 Tax=Methyloceanibacter methanicus TaxID=1774968 RepID=A0A1E3VZS6_9HYPH|nr:hypothetical protein [Methyloceanibacter methanicus]ODR99032.1 hypothetical protein AUC68_07760 [Methyloceanibacter methanicus]